jgi:hypothetical protein
MPVVPKPGQPSASQPLRKGLKQRKLYPTGPRLPCGCATLSPNPPQRVMIIIIITILMLSVFKGNWPPCLKCKHPGTVRLNQSPRTTTPRRANTHTVTPPPTQPNVEPSKPPHPNNNNPRQHQPTGPDRDKNAQKGATRTQQEATQREGRNKRKAQPQPETAQRSGLRRQSDTKRYRQRRTSHRNHQA